LAQQTQLIGWRPTNEGWFSLNSDGSLYTQRHQAAAGGLIRDSGGRFITSYAANLGSCSIMRAELRDIIEGIRIAWDMRIRKLCIQTDSRAVVTIIEEKESRSHRHSSLVEQFQDLKS
ncbi:Putative ribonuclease H protein At1g65750, partial [Linum perenne]